MDDALERRDRDRVEAQMFEIDLLRLLVEDTHHHTLLVCAGRYRRDADVDLAATECARDAAILRQAFLGNIKFGHHLDARDQARSQLDRKSTRLNYRHSCASRMPSSA